MLTKPVSHTRSPPMSMSMSLRPVRGLLLIALLALAVAACEGGIISLGSSPAGESAGVDLAMAATPVVDMTVVVVPKPLVISEIMYRPVDENAAVDNHEFIEIFNPDKAAVDLSGWTLSGK